MAASANVVKKTDTQALIDKKKQGHRDRVRVFHILCKHIDSRNPTSRRTNQPITISTEEAHSELHGFKLEFSDIEEKSDIPWGLFEAFKQGANERSDCGSFKKYGDLGWFGKGQMQKAFEEASFALANGELSDIVDTASGSHLLLRWEHEDFPPQGPPAYSLPKKPSYQETKARFAVPKSSKSQGEKKKKQNR